MKNTVNPSNVFWKILIAVYLFLYNNNDSIAQLPSNVPQDGLTAWWPFTGNAADASGNGHNGIVSGAALSTDRNGVANSAYSFNGINSKITVNDHDNLSFVSHKFSISFWVNFNSNPNKDLYVLCKRGESFGHANWEYAFLKRAGDHFSQSKKISMVLWNPEGSCHAYADGAGTTVYQVTSLEQVWEHYVITADGSIEKVYKNGILEYSVPRNTNCNMGNGTGALTFGFGGAYNVSNYFEGKIDDIGFWNRALTPQEVKVLYEGDSSCNETFSTQPANQDSSIGSDVQFSAIHEYSNGNYQWQTYSNNQGWINIPANSNYSGETTNTLTVQNIQTTNDLEQFRVIVSTNNCTDTSQVAVLTINDIDLNVLPSSKTLLKVYPNPASNYLNIEYNQYIPKGGYRIRIENNWGQNVFEDFLNQGGICVNSSGWSGKGLYILTLFDAEQNTVDKRKIVIH
jgi:uncharacterized protein YaiE (UPF0345 family)